MNYKKPSISRTFLWNMTAVAVISIIVLASIWIYSVMSGFDIETGKMRRDYIASRKTLLTNEVNRAVSFILYNKAQTEKRLKESIKGRVYNAYSIAMHIYEKNKDSKNSREIKEMIIEAIRPIRFNDGRGYYFMVEFSGIVQLFADRPQVEGVNLLEQEMETGETVVKDMITIATEKGEGFYRYEWTKPGTEGKHHLKMAFVKHFEPFNWYIGTGEYMADFTRDVQKNVLSRIADIRYETDEYIFVGQYDGLSLAGPASGRNMLHVTDPNGIRVVEELITKAKSGGGFVSYVMPNLDNKRQSHKISFSKGIDDWQWYVGSGLYIDEIETEIERKGIELKADIQADIIKILVLLLGLIGFSFFMARRVARKTEASYKALTEFFDMVEDSTTMIDSSVMEFDEFEKLAESASEMIEARRKAEKAIIGSDRKIRALFDQSFQFLGLLNAEGLMLEVNQTALDFAGAKKEEVIGNAFWLLPWWAHSKTEQDRVRDAVLRAAQEKTIRFETTNISVDGTLHDIDFSLKPFTDEEGAVVYLIPEGRDITRQKKDNLALRESEKRYRALFELSGDGIFLLKGNQVVDCNPKTLEIFRCSREQILSRPFSMFSPEFQTDGSKSMEKALEISERAVEGESVSLEWLHCRYDGTPFDAEVTMSVLDIGGERHVLATIRDATDRKKTMEKVRESKERLSMALSVVGGSVWDMYMTEDGILFDGVDSRALGYETGELPKTLIGLLDIVHPDDKDPIMEAVNAHIRGEAESYSIEHRVRLKSGEYMWVFSQGRIIERDQDGNPLRMIGTAIDISSRKKAEAERIRLATAIEQADEDIVITDINGLIEYANPAFERITGYSRDEAIGQKTSILKSGLHDITFYQNLWQTILSGASWKGRFINKTKEGGFIQQDATISPILDSKGKIEGFVSVNRDVTEKIRLETQLRQSQKMEAIGALAGGIAHDFNNILAGIIGFTELGLEAESKELPVQRYLDRVLQAGARAKDLVDNILAFSRQSEKKREPLLIGPIVKEAIKLMRASLPSTIEIRQDIAADPGMVLADPTEIHQVVMNLCTNAAQALREKGGILEVSLSRALPEQIAMEFSSELASEQFLLLGVKDNGIGMSPETIERIFDPYFTTKEKGEGTGLGLSVVLGIIKGSSGHVTVRSEPGRGSAFIILFPLIAKDDVIYGMETVNQAPGGTEAILFVDDEPDLVEAWGAVLKGLGYSVFIETNGSAALDAFKNKPDKYDLVITDQTMPGMTGTELAAEIMRIKPGAPVILSTGYSEAVDEKKAEELGIRGFIRKPFKKEELARLIRVMFD